jgi:hypothetical protein
MLELSIAILAAAVLYASVGHGGASAYIAIFTLSGLTPASFRTEVLVMNVLVASVSWFRFYRSGHFSFKYLLPFLPASVSMAALGSFLGISWVWVSIMAGLSLFIAAGWLIIRACMTLDANESLNPFSLLTSSIWGALMGFVSGITGVGGGIFLSPLMALSRRYPLKLISGLSAAFIVINSLVSLIVIAWKQPSSFHHFHLSATVLLLLPFAGLLGSHLGNTVKNLNVLRLLLAAVLLFAAYKLLMKGLL